MAASHWETQQDIDTDNGNQPDSEIKGTVEYHKGHMIVVRKNGTKSLEWTVYVDNESNSGGGHRTRKNAFSYGYEMAERAEGNWSSGHSRQY